MDKNNSPKAAGRRPRPAKHNIVFRILLAAYLGLLLFLCFGHFDNLPQMSPTLWGIPKDKIVHFLMFLPFPVLLFLAYDKITSKPWHSVLFSVAAFLAGCLLAAATELVQSTTTYRSGDPNDFKADALALAVGALAALVIDLRKQFAAPKAEAKAPEDAATTPQS